MNEARLQSILKYGLIVGGSSALTMLAIQFLIRFMAKTLLQADVTYELLPALVMCVPFALIGGLIGAFVGLIAPLKEEKPAALKERIKAPFEDLGEDRTK